MDVIDWDWFKLWWKHSNVTEKNSNRNLLPYNTSEGGGGEFECFSVHLISHFLKQMSIVFKLIKIDYSK